MSFAVREFHGTCTEAARSLCMDEQHQHARKLYLDTRRQRKRGREQLRFALSRRMQMFFITLRRVYDKDANAILSRAEQRA